MYSIAFLLLCATAVLADNLTVSIAQGTLQGFMIGGSSGSPTPARAWLGIPFGTSTSGLNRFKRSYPANPWTGVRDASKFGFACPQDDLNGVFGAQDEDCLNLNVYAPANSSASSMRPVMIWIYGGAFTAGSNVLAMYQGANMCNNGDVVVVAINYRLGVLGFAASDIFFQESNTSGTFGLLDQRLAMRWVISNVAAFGGDPSQVTVFGESAGSISVCFHLVMPGSAGLFRRAIMESGPCLQGTHGPDVNPHWFDQESAKNKTNLAMAAANCTTIACLRDAPLATVMRAQGSVYSGPLITWGPAIDWIEIPGDPLTLFTDGRNLQGIEIMLGSNTDEGTAFTIPWNSTDQQYRDTLLIAYANQTISDAVYQMYPTASFVNVSTPGHTPAAYAYAAGLGDAFFWCPARRLLAILETQSNQKIYAYRFNHAPSFMWFVPWFGVAHAYELYFVWMNDMAPSPKAWNFTAPEVVLAKTMDDFWTSFATTGVPVSSSATPPIGWPTYGADRTVINLDLALSLSADYRQVQCDFWNSLTPVC